MPCFVLYISVLASSQTKLHFYLNCQQNLLCEYLTMNKDKEKAQKYLDTLCMFDTAMESSKT